MDTLTLLDSERATLITNVARVPEPERSRRPSADCWSIAEVLEHLAVVERGIVKLITLRGREVPAADAAPAAPLSDDRVAALRGRVRRIEAPERVRPTGTMTATDALRALEETRGALRQALLAANPTSLDGCTHTHPVLGTLTLRDWVHFVAHHEARHAAQIAEIAERLPRESSQGDQGDRHHREIREVREGNKG
jgi:uncharacterized damage-inducible protein DinB